jgi:hypothetical protein
MKGHSSKDREDPRLMRIGGRYATTVVPGSSQKLISTSHSAQDTMNGFPQFTDPCLQLDHGYNLKAAQ